MGLAAIGRPLAVSLDFQSALRAARPDVPTCAGNLRPRRGMLTLDGEAMGGYAGAVGDGS
jgi:hypothetical protein